MNRRSTRLSTGTSTPSSSRKRALPSSASSSRPAKTQRRSATSKKATPTRTPRAASDIMYADNTGLTSSESEDDLGGANDEESAFGSDGAVKSADEPSDVSEESADDDDDSDDSRNGSRRRSKASTKSKSAPSKKTPQGKDVNGHELLRQGAELPMEPGVEIVIKRPKARGPGKTLYADDRIHPNTMLFLEELRENNERSWLKLHDPDFRQAEKDFKVFIEQLTEKLCEIDETVPELPTKDIIFRIYRDVRFSKDPTPYKAYFSAAWSRTGRKGPYAAYYLQLQPGKCFIGGGSYGPDAQALSRMRADIDRNPSRIRDVLLNDGIRKEFLSGAPKNEKKIIKAYTGFGFNKDSALKTCPKGFDKGHKDIELLRLKNYTLGRKLNDEEVTNPDFMTRVVGLFATMQPYITYLNDVIMPDPTARSGGGTANGGDSSDDEDEDEEEDVVDDEGSDEGDTGDSDGP